MSKTILLYLPRGLVVRLLSKGEEMRAVVGKNNITGSVTTVRTTLDWS